MGRQGLGTTWVDPYRCQDAFPGLVGPFRATGGRFGAIFQIFRMSHIFPDYFSYFPYYSPVWLAYYSPVWLAYFCTGPTNWARKGAGTKFHQPGPRTIGQEASGHRTAGRCSAQPTHHTTPHRIMRDSPHRTAPHRIIARKTGQTNK